LPCMAQACSVRIVLFKSVHVPFFELDFDEARTYFQVKR
jgi:hypothetical protein